MDGRRNIRKALERADSIDIAEGRVAYFRYREVMEMLAARYNHPLERVCAAFAALSPNNSYVLNLRSLVSILEGFREGRGIEAITVSTYKHCGERALLYLDGRDFLGTVTGKKIRSFYRNIINPLDPEPVTIDGHAFNLWAGEVRTMKEAVRHKLRYDEVAEGFRLEARRVGLLPHQLQAILWFCWKRVNKIIYDGQLGLFQDGDQWKTLIRPEEIQPFAPKMQAPGMREKSKRQEPQVLLSSLLWDEQAGEESKPPY
jgi:hypothetical protein